ncbi:MAG: hypothetical protein HY725_00540 [Candidatus Rokubacteria bacterium]|nr:hypothetical protein [Candidatus Rokubacteria bacterium]
MRQSYTAVVERANPLSGEFATEPYETGWAREAVIFVKVREEPGDNVELRARVQISPDGIDWVDEGTTFPAIRRRGVYFVKVSNFGNWLRLAGRVTDPGAKIRALVYIALKE